MIRINYVNLVDGIVVIFKYAHILLFNRIIKQTKIQKMPFLWKIISFESSFVKTYFTDPSK
jgi:hypothetical protein